MVECVDKDLGLGLGFRVRSKHDLLNQWICSDFRVIKQRLG